MRTRGRYLWTALAVGALTLAACEQAGEDAELEDEPFAEDTVGWDLDDEADGDFETEAREAGERIEEGVKKGVQAVGEGTERLGKEIQESVDTEEERDSVAP